MNIRPIRCETDYDAALEMIDSLMGAAPDTPEGDWLDVLVTLVESYEARRWPVEAPDPVAMIEHAMEARGYRQKDLATVIGSQPHALRSAESPTASDPADDPRSIGRMEDSGRRARARVRPRTIDASENHGGFRDSVAADRQVRRPGIPYQAGHCVQLLD